MKYCIRFYNSGVVKRASLRAYSPERRSWGRINTLCSHLDQNMLRNNALFLEKSYRRIQFWCVKALGAHQHTLQSFKNTILSRNEDQNMLKNALFFGKSWKNRRIVGGSASKPLWPPAAGVSASRPPSCYSHLIYVLFQSIARISRHR